MHPGVVFIEHKPFMSVELLGLLNEYRIVCYNNDSTYRLLSKNWSITSYGNTKFNDELESDQVVERMLGDSWFMDGVISDRAVTKVLLFYMTSNIDQRMKDSSIQMALPHYELQERLGDKLNLPWICQKANVSFSKCIVFRKSAVCADMFDKCVSNFGLPFVVQGSEGASGSETFLINSEESLHEAVNGLKNSFKVTKYLRKNIPLSVQVCVLNSKLIVRGPYLQLLGLAELSHKPFQFSGNDTNQSLFSPELIAEVRTMSERIGEYCRLEGYRGIMGIDYLWNCEDNTVVVQELNTRLVGLTRLLTGMQRDQGLLPDLVQHVNLFGKFSLSQRANELFNGEVDLSKNGYSQLIIRNNCSQTRRSVHCVEPGIYRIVNGSLMRVKESLFVQDMVIDDILVCSSVYAHCDLYPGESMARIILKQSVIQNSAFSLTDNALNIIKTIRNYIMDSSIEL